MDILNWLFTTPKGIGVLVFVGMIIFTLVAAISERKTHRLYFNHEEQDEWEKFFSDDEDEDEKASE